MRTYNENEGKTKLGYLAPSRTVRRHALAVTSIRFCHVSCLGLLYLMLQYIYIYMLDYSHQQSIVTLTGFPFLPNTLAPTCQPSISMASALAGSFAAAELESCGSAAASLELASTTSSSLMALAVPFCWGCSA